MAKYELSDDQIKQIISILNNATVRVIEAPVIMRLVQALQRPIYDDPKKKGEEGGRGGGDNKVVTAT